MDSRQSGYSSTGTDLPYSTYPATATSIPTRVFGTLKFDSRNSPNSPFSIPFDTEIVPTYSDSQEQHSSTDTLSVSSNSSLDYNSYLQRPTPQYYPQGNPFIHSNTHFVHNGNSNQQIRNTLLELESALMDEDEGTAHSEPLLGENMQSQPQSQRPRSWNQDVQGSQTRQSESPRDPRFGGSSNDFRIEKYQTAEKFVPSIVPPQNLKQLLVACAKALSENKLDEFEKLEQITRASVSITGEPIQRLGAYMIEGLVARKDSSGTNIYRTLKCNQPASKDLLSYMHILYEICPYLKFGYMAANGAIAEACKNDDRIHIIDFQIAQGTQWLTLLQALASRPSGAPHVRITGIDDPVSKYARGAGLAAVERRFAEVAQKFNIPVEFHAVPVFAPDITKEMLDVRPGEALAVNFPLQLHHTPDESVDVSNPRDGLLRMVKSLSPKVVTLIEQESNTNTAPFLPRFIETLDFYSAMFESIDVTMSREKKERINVEQQCLARDMVNIIACEGKERVERHELLGKWRLRFMMAGFRPFPLSSYVNSVIRGLLKCYSVHYTLVEKDGGMLLGWKDRNLVSSSAWH